MRLFIANLIANLAFAERAPELAVKTVHRRPCGVAPLCGWRRWTPSEGSSAVEYGGRRSEWWQAGSSSILLF
jgi:hypothetical protein